MKNSFIYVCTLLSLLVLGSTKVNAQFLEATETVDIVQIGGFDDGGNIPQYYVADLGTETDSIAWTAQTGDITKWYKIPAGGVSNGTEDVQAYYYKNVATGRYLYISDATLELLAADDGDWPTQKAEASEVNEKTAAFKWFDRVVNPDWPWAICLTNASGINLEKRDGNRYNSLTGIILMKVNESGGQIDTSKEFFGVYVPCVSVGGFAGGLGNVWAVVKAPAVVEAGVPNPDIQHFLENTETVDVVKIAGFDDGGNIPQYYVADLGTETDSIAWTASVEDYCKWYKIPAGSVSNGIEDVQAYYYKNVATGRYLYISAATLELLAADDGDWPTQKAEASHVNEKTAAFKWFDRAANPDWPWAIYLTNAAGINLEKRDGNRYNSLTGIILMKVGESGGQIDTSKEFFGVYVPCVSVGGFAGGLGNVWAVVKAPVVAETGVSNPDFFPDNARMVDVIQIPGFNNDGNMTQYYLADLGADTDSIAWTAESTSVSEWYKIPAGGVSDSTTDVQAYYYKNVATGRYLYISDATLSELAGDDGDWPTKRAQAANENAQTAAFKWFDRASNWPWGIYISNAAGINMSKREGNQYNALTGIILMKINEGGINGEEFFGVYEPNASVGGFAGGTGNAWTAVKTPFVLRTALNPDYVSDGSFSYSIAALNFFATDDGESDDAASYNDETHTITYKNGGWHRAGWNWEADGGIDASVFNQVWIKFDASALPKTGDGEGGSTKLQFDVVYMDDSNAAEFDNKSNEIHSDATEYFYNLTPGKKIKRITLKSEAEGDIVLTDAYFFKRGIDPVDLAITDITWTPQNPVLGDSILFSATIKNQSEFASPAVKHGVVFGVKLPGTDGNGTLVGWSDTHLTSIAPGESVTVTINGGPQGSNGKWKPGAAKTFAVVALVNDQKDILESDYNNNTKEVEITISNPPVDLVVTDISWSPAEPVLGDAILLSATIKNESAYTSQNVKHGVAFSISGTVVAWSDTHMTALKPSESVTLTANGGPNGGGGEWTPAMAKTFTVQAQVNDQHDVLESDYDNNIMSKDVIVTDKTAVGEIEFEGSVYVENRNIHLVNFSEYAVVSIYNLQAKKIGEFNATEVSQQTLPTDFYILNVQDGEKLSKFKIIIR